MVDRILALLKVFRYLRLKPFDIATEQGRSAERHRRIALTAASSIAGKFLTMLVPLVTIPLTLRYLGKEQYGIWMTLTSITNTLVFADLGIGLGLLNKLTEAIGRDDRQSASACVSSAFIVLGAVSIVLGAVYIACASHIPWSLLFKSASPEAIRIVRPAMAVFIGCFVFNLPLGVIERVYLACQEGFVNSIAFLCGSAAYLFGIIFVVKVNLGLLGLICVSSGVPMLRYVVTGVRMFGWKRKWLMPSFQRFDRAIAKDLLSTGSMFLILQIALAVGYASDNIVISTVRGATAVADYSVPSKLFAVISGCVGMITVPFWPAIREAASIGDGAWVKRTFKRTILMIFVVTAAASMLLFATANVLIRYWTHNQLRASLPLLAALAIWTVVWGIGNFVWTFLNSLGALRFQVVVCSVAAAINIALSIWFTERIGAAGVVLGSTVSQLMAFIPICWYMLPRIFRDVRVAERRATAEV